MKRFITILSAGFLTVCAVSSGILLRTVSAEETISAPTISVSEAWAQPGETVFTALTVQQNPGIAALSLNIEYDPQKLTLLDASGQADWNSAVFIAGGDKTAIPYTLNWDSDGMTDFTADCILAKLQFAVKDGASGDAVISVSVNQDSTFHADFSDARFQTQNGVIHIGAVTTTATTETTGTTTVTTETVPVEPEWLRGDIDNNGIVDVTDAQLALNAYVEIMSYKPSGLSETAFRAGDVDRSGGLDIPDAQYILQYYTLNTISQQPTAWEQIIL